MTGEWTACGGSWPSPAPRPGVSTPGATSSSHCRLWRAWVHPVTSQSPECARPLPATEPAAPWSSAASAVPSPGTAERGSLSRLVPPALRALSGDFGSQAG